MAPLIAAALKFLASAAAAKALEQATPKKGIVPTQEAPALEAMDLQQLVSGGQQKQQSQLPQQKLQLSNRLPRPY